jgi:hypothetical protein
MAIGMTSRFFKNSLCVLGVICASASYAAPEEIQVYLDEFAESGEFGLDIHSNYVLTTQLGIATNNRKMLRATPELSYGINKNWEVAGYWLTSKGPDQNNGHFVSDGIKARVKWRPDSSVNAEKNGSPWYYAINFEIGKVNPRFNPDQRLGQLKLIGMYKSGNWTLGGNYNLDRALNAGTALGTTSELDIKVAYRIGGSTEKPVSLGLENYGYRGAISGPLSGLNQNRMTFVAADFEIANYEFNVGIGRSFGVTEDKHILKLILGIPFN